jgi:hypothetical protein
MKRSALTPATVYQLAGYGPTFAATGDPITFERVRGGGAAGATGAVMYPVELSGPEDTYPYGITTGKAKPIAGAAIASAICPLADWPDWWAAHVARVDEDMRVRAEALDERRRLLAVAAAVLLAEGHDLGPGNMRTAWGRLVSVLGSLAPPQRRYLVDAMTVAADTRSGETDDYRTRIDEAAAWLGRRGDY